MEEELASTTKQLPANFVDLSVDVLTKVAKHLDFFDVANFACTTRHTAVACRQVDMWQGVLDHFRWNRLSILPRDASIIQDPHAMFRWRYQAELNMYTDSPVQCWASDKAARHVRNTSSVCVNRRHKIVASTSAGSQIKLWNLQGQELHTLDNVEMDCTTTSYINTAFDVLTLFDNHARLCVKDVHTCQDVWVDNVQRWMGIADVPERAPRHSQIINDNLILACYQNNNIAVHDTRIRNGDPAIVRRGTGCDTPPLKCVYAVHPSALATRADAITDFQQFVALHPSHDAAYADTVLTMYDLRMMINMPHALHPTMTRALDLSVEEVDLTGSRLLLADMTGPTVQILDVHSPTQPPILTSAMVDLRSPCHGLKLTDDARHVVGVCMDGSVAVWKVVGDGLRRPFELRRGADVCSAWGVVPGRLASGMGTGRNFVWAVDVVDTVMVGASKAGGVLFADFGGGVLG